MADRPDKNPQKQIIDELRDVESILITVNTNPTVDELSAALGLTLLLNKMNKHATAVFSGAIPPAIKFLEPEKTFEDTTNSLRDFIIALDKEKADHLRYKVDGDMVKIFITPYRTTISEQDLEFSQGDYNVELVVALGVRNADDLDRALVDHGKIMHDATIASLSVGDEASDLGSINWHDDEAGSYSEMLVAIADALKDGKNLIDEQIANAFLTGIVAATDRFSNRRTTSNSMTVAAQLMAAGANQQLIATQLEEAEEIPQPTPVQKPQEPEQASQPKQAKPKDQQAPDGTMLISHEKQGSVDEVAAQVEQEQQTEAQRRAEESLAEKTSSQHQILDDFVKQGSHGAAGSSIATLSDDLDAAQNDTDSSIAPQTSGPSMSLPTPQEQYEPLMGGTLNATTEQAAADKLREERSDRNKKLLSHDHASGQYVGTPPADLPAINSFTDNTNREEPTSIVSEGSDFATARAASITPPSMPNEPASVPASPTLADLDAQNRHAQTQLPHDEARAAIEDAFNNGPANQQQGGASNSPLPPPVAPMPSVMPDDVPPPPDVPMMPQELMYDASTTQVEMPPQTQAQPAPAQDDASIDLPSLPPMPDFSTLPPLPAGASPQSPQPFPPQDFTPPAGSSAELDAAFPPQPPVPGAMPQSDDPNQFQIPGQ